MRAMVLAAGLGTRLRPLTLSLPKPLVPVCHRPMVAYLLYALKDAGVRDIVLNTHHLPEAFPRVLGDGASMGLSLSYSHEPALQGTGGGLRQAEALLGEGTVLLLNGDFLIEVDLPAVVAGHLAAREADPKVVSTMVLRRDPAAARYGAIGVDEAGRVVDFVGRATVPGAEVFEGGLFTGIHVLEPEVRAAIPKEGTPCINKTAYPAAMGAGYVVRSHFQGGHWSDLGTPWGYLRANMDVLYGRVTMPGPDPRSQHGAVFVPEGETRTIEGAQVIGPVSLGAGASLGEGAVIGPGVVIGAGARVGEGCRIERAVIWERCQVGGGSTLNSAIVYQSPEGASLILQTEDKVGDPGR